jgi:hypothetical protein
LTTAFVAKTRLSVGGSDGGHLLTLRNTSTLKSLQQFAYPAASPSLHFPSTNRGWWSGAVHQKEAWLRVLLRLILLALWRAFEQLPQ